MPRIPLSEKQRIQVQQDSVFMQGAPGLGWKLGEGQAIINAGERIGQGIYGIGKSIADYAKKKMDTEDKLAAQDDYNLFKATSDKLKYELAEYPGLDDEQKEIMINNWRTEYEEQRKPFLERMSGSFRQLHDSRMRGVAAGLQEDIRLLLRNGEVTRLQNHAETQFQTAIKNGDIEGAKKIASEHEGTLFSRTTADKMRMIAEQQAPYYLAKRAIEAGERNVSQKIKDGYFGPMPENLKDRLLTLDKTMTLNRENQSDTEYIAGILDGSIFPDDEEVIHASERGDISKKQEVRRLKINKAAREEIRRAENREARAATAEKVQEKREADKKRRDKMDAFKFELATTMFPTNPTAAALVRNTWYERAEVAFPNDPKSQLALRKEIDRATENGMTGKSEFSMPGGAEVLAFIQKSYGEDEYHAKNLYRDPPGLLWFNREDSATYQRARYYEMIDRAKALLRSGAPANQIIKDLSEQGKLINAAMIDKILTPAQNNERRREKRRLPNGDIAVKLSDGTIVIQEEKK